MITLKAKIGRNFQLQPRSYTIIYYYIILLYSYTLKTVYSYTIIFLNSVYIYWA